MSDRPRRPHGTGSVYQDHGADCPTPQAVTGTDGTTRMVRPAHRCAHPWVGSVELGWTVRGTRRRKRVKAPTEKLARAKLVELLRTATESEAPVVGGKPTVHTWAEQWLTNTERRLRPKTWQNNRSAVRRWIVPTIGHRKLETLTPGDMRAVSRAILAAGREESTALRAEAVLKKMLRDAILEGHKMPHNVLMVETTTAGETDRDAIPLDETLVILEAATHRPDESRWVAAFLQALRPAEALGLTWAAVDWVEHQIDISWQLRALPYRVPRDRASGFRIPSGYEARRLDGALHLVRPKTQSGRRVIPLVPWLEQSLRQWRTIAPPSPHGLVWPRSDGRPALDWEDRAAWFDLVDAARVARCDPSPNPAGAGRPEFHGRRYALYEARHTAASLLRELGVDDETIVAIMGHATILSTRAYLHTSTVRTRAALEGLADRLGLTAASEPAPALDAGA